jgi:signal peptidase II
MTVSKQSDYIRFAAISMVIIVVDFITKKWMLSLLFEIPQQIVITSFFNLTPVWNKGVSFGIMSSHPEIIRFIIPILALLVILFFISQIHLQQPMQQIGSAIIAGGAAGNVIDRFLYGKVVDFFDFHIGGYHWPAFNIADIAICAGVAIMIYVIIWPSSKFGEE